MSGFRFNKDCEVSIHDVVYIVGPRCSGKTSAINAVLKENASISKGHVHIFSPNANECYNMVSLLQGWPVASDFSFRFDDITLRRVIDQHDKSIHKLFIIDDALISESELLSQLLANPSEYNCTFIIATQDAKHVVHPTVSILSLPLPSTNTNEFIKKVTPSANVDKVLEATNEINISRQSVFVRSDKIYTFKNFSEMLQKYINDFDNQNPLYKVYCTNTKKMDDDEFVALQNLLKTTRSTVRFAEDAITVFYKGEIRHIDHLIDIIRTKCTPVKPPSGGSDKNGFATGVHIYGGCNPTNRYSTWKANFAPFVALYDFCILWDNYLTDYRDAMCTSEEGAFVKYRGLWYKMDDFIAEKLGEPQVFDLTVEPQMIYHEHFQKAMTLDEFESLRKLNCKLLLREPYVHVIMPDGSDIPLDIQLGHIQTKIAPLKPFVDEKLHGGNPTKEDPTKPLGWIAYAKTFIW